MTSKNSVVKIFLCLASILLFVSCGSQNKHLSKGKELIKSDKRRKEERAVAEFKEAVKFESDNAEAHYLLGYYDEWADIEVRGEQMYKSYQNDKRKYREILVLETLRQNDTELMKSALGALTRIYKSGSKDRKNLMDELYDAIKSKDSRDRYDAQWVLANLGKSQKDNGKIIDELIELLDHKRMETRLEAVIALGEIGDERAVEPLLKLVNSGSEKDPDDREPPEVRRHAVEALGKIGGEAVSKLVDILQNKGSSMRVDAIEALAKLGDDRAVLPFIEVLGEEGSREVEVKF